MGWFFIPSSGSSFYDQDWVESTRIIDILGSGSSQINLDQVKSTRILDMLGSGLSCVNSDPKLYNTLSTSGVLTLSHVASTRLSEYKYYIDVILSYEIFDDDYLSDDL